MKDIPRTIEDILAIEDIGLRIEYLKKGRRTPLPDTAQNYKDWSPKEHDIMNESKVKNIRVMVEAEKTTFDEKTGKTVTVPAKYEEKKPNRIALPLEQDIVNIQTAFTVGLEPRLDCDVNDSKEDAVLSAVKGIFKTNKLKYLNRKEVRSWLSEQDVAEYWYKVEDDSFWARLKRKVADIFGSAKPKYKMKCAVWSPFRGDVLYPFFDDNGDMVAFSRSYKMRDYAGNEHECFMVITKTNVYLYELDGSWRLVPEKSFVHGFKKLPVIYTGRSDAYCAKIRSVRERLEKTLSGYADCIDNHYFPKLMLFGELENLMGGDARNIMLQMQGEGADARYLTWNQSADPIKTEIDTYFNQAYALTNTPRISFDQIKGTTALSGVAFRYVFMSAHMAVANHGEELGEFFQRRVNFLVSAVGTLNTSLQEAANSIGIDVEIQPFIIDSDADKVNTAVAAVSGGVWSTEHGVAYCSDYGELKDELDAIREEKAAGDVEGE